MFYLNIGSTIRICFKIFIDFAKFYAIMTTAKIWESESITRTKIKEVIKYKCTEKLIRLTRMLVVDSKANVKFKKRFRKILKGD